MNVQEIENYIPDGEGNDQRRVNLPPCIVQGPIEKVVLQSNDGFLRLFVFTWNKKTTHHVPPIRDSHKGEGGQEEDSVHVLSNTPCHTKLIEEPDKRVLSTPLSK